MRARTSFILLPVIVAGSLSLQQVCCAQTPESLSAMDDFFESVEDQDPPVPDYFISGLALDGRVIENRAELSVEIEIRVLAEDRWLRIPLGLDQALLLQYSHRGEGMAGPAVNDEAADGLTWMLSGQGVHTLTLGLRVPLRQTTNSSQLQLMVPELSKLFVGDLRLRIPGDQLAVQLGDDVQLLSQSQMKDGETEVLASVTGDRIDVRWHPVVEESEPISRTLTNLTLRLRDHHVELTARQELRLRQSGLPFVEVRLPSSAFGMTAAVRVGDASGAERQVSPLAAERDGWVRVPLDGVIGTAVRFDWSFEMPFDESTSTLHVDGLEVAGAADQSGTIAVEGFDRHLLTRRASSDGGVERIGVDELSMAGAFANLAYRFQSGSYRLVLDVDPRESTFRVTPIYVLSLSEQRTDLSARFLVSLDEGQIDALSARWPRFSTQGWNVEPVALGGGEVRRDEVTSTAGAEGNSPGEVPTAEEANPPAAARWLLKPSKPLENGSEVGLSANRAHASVEPPELSEIVLPEILGARMLPGVLLVAMADNVEALVQPTTGLTLIERTTFPSVPEELFRDLNDRLQLAYEVVRNDADAPLTVEVAMTVQPRSIQTNAGITVEKVDTGSRITQTIDFDVTFGRLSSVRFQVPALLHREVPDNFRSESLRFSLEGQLLPATWNGAEVELHLPAAKRGPFQVTLGPYTTPSLQKRTERIEVPIVNSADQPFDSVRLTVPDLGTVALSVASEGWTQLPTIPDGAEWITRSSPESVTLDLDHRLAAVPQRLVIPIATIQSEVSESGSARTRAQYQLDADCSRVVVQLPSGAELWEFAWEGHGVEFPYLTQHGEAPNQFLVQRPVEPTDGESWLSITYTVHNEPLRWSQSSSIAFPTFGSGVTVVHTLWDVKLPRSQHLLTRPNGLSQQYAWARSGIVWSRSPAAEYRDLRGGLISRGAVEAFPIDGHNVYPFETLGTLRNVRVRSMSNSLLVFFGAGLTLTASFLVMKVPQVRRLWFWLAMGTLGALLSLWYLEAILLLLQPAAYGLLLPLCAALLERFSERTAVSSEAFSTRGSFELTLPDSENSRLSSPSSVDPALPSTLVRPTAVTDSGGR